MLCVEKIRNSKEKLTFIFPYLLNRVKKVIIHPLPLEGNMTQWNFTPTLDFNAMSFQVIRGNDSSLIFLYYL